MPLPDWYNKTLEFISENLPPFSTPDAILIKPGRQLFVFIKFPEGISLYREQICVSDVGVDSFGPYVFAVARDYDQNGNTEPWFREKFYLSHQGVVPHPMFSEYHHLPAPSYEPHHWDKSRFTLLGELFPKHTGRRLLLLQSWNDFKSLIYDLL